jgi:hypothetical protein
MNTDRHPLTLILPTDWTPQQALAVVEILDDLRERIYSHYLIPIQTLLRDERTLATDELDTGTAADFDNPPF